MGTLLITADQLNAFKSQLEELEWLVALQAELDSFAENVEELDALEAIDLYLEEVLAFTDTFKSWLDQHSISEAALKVLWNHLEQRFDEQVPAKYRVLLQTFEAVRNADNQVEILNWPLLNHNADSNPLAGVDVGLGFAIASSMDLMIYGKPKGHIPAVAALEGHGCVGVKVAGSISGELAARIPVQAGSASFSVSTDSSLEACYYYRHKLSSRVVNGLIRDLKAVPFPLDVKQLKAAFEQSSTLHAISFHSDRGFVAKGQLQLASTAMALSQGVTVENLGLKVGFDAHSETSTQFQLYQDTRHEQNWLVVEVSRQSDKAAGVYAELGIELNARQHAQSVSGILVEHLTELKDLLDMLRLESIADLSFVKDKLFKELGNLSSDQGWQKVLGVLKGDDEGSSLSDYLKQQVSENVTNQASTIEEAVAEALSDFVAEQLEALGDSELSALAGAYASDLSARLMNLVSEYTNDMSGALLKKLADSDQFEKLAEVVEKAGVQLDKTAGDLRSELIKKIQPVETLVRKYFKHVEQLQSVAEAASKANVKAAISYQRRRQKQSSLLMKVKIRWEALNGLEGAVESLLLGDARPLIDVYQQGNTNIEFETGLLTSVAISNRSLGFAVTLFNFEISGKGLLETDTVIEKNFASGEITVTSRSKLEKRSQAFGNYRYIQFVNVMQLASSRVLPTASLSLTINRQEEKLEQSELTDFLRSLEKAGLITDAQRLHAEGTIFEAHKSQSGGYIGDAQLTLGFSLSSEEVLRLLKRENTLADMKLLYETIKDVLLDLRIVKERFVDELRMFSSYEDKVHDYDSLMDFAFDDHFEHEDREFHRIEKRSRVHRSNTNQSTRYKRLKPFMATLNEWTTNTEKLHKSLMAMKHVVAAGASQSDDYYREKQEVIAKSMSEWVKIRGAFFGGDTIRDETLALMMVLSRLLGVYEPGMAPLNLVLSYQRNNQMIAVDLLPV